MKNMWEIMSRLPARRWLFEELFSYILNERNKPLNNISYCNPKGGEAGNRCHMHIIGNVFGIL